MKKSRILFGAMALFAIAFTACNNQPVQETVAFDGLMIQQQGVFSSGGRVTDPIPGEYDATQNWMDPTRKGTTTHVDHANTFYQIPANGNGQF